MSTKSLNKQTDTLLDKYGNVFFGRPIEQLSSLIEQQSKVIFERMGLIIPVRSCSLMVTLAYLKSATASDLARQLNQTHQLTMQKVPKLVELGLISRHDDNQDARRKTYRLTRRGRAQLKIFQQCAPLLSEAYENLFAEVGDLQGLVLHTTDCLKKTPLIDRIDF